MRWGVPSVSQTTHVWTGEWLLNGFCITLLYLNLKLQEINVRCLFDDGCCRPSVQWCVSSFDLGVPNHNEVQNQQQSGFLQFVVTTSSLFRSFHFVERPGKSKSPKWGLEREMSQEDNLSDGLIPSEWISSLLDYKNDHENQNAILSLVLD